MFDFSQMFSTVSGTIGALAGIVALMLALLIYLFRARQKILVTKLLADACWTVHYFLLGAYSGACLNFIAIGRELVFFNRDRRKWAGSAVWVYIFIGVTVISGLLSWQGPVSLLPMVGSVFSVVALWCRDPFHIRLLSLPMILLWLVYAVISGSPSAMICNILSAVSIVVGLAKDIRVKLPRTA